MTAAGLPNRSGRRWLGANHGAAGYQRHHLIPIALAARPQFSAFFGSLCAHGLDLREYGQNGLLLPADEVRALMSGHALHRGPHRGYDDVIAARVEAIRSTFAEAPASGDDKAAVAALSRLRLLQSALRRALTDRHRQTFKLNRFDPMRLFADRPYLDDAIGAMFAVQNAVDAA